MIRNHLVFLFALLLICTQAISQKNGPFPLSNNESTSVVETWYGTIDGIHEIEMTLTKSENSLEGFYILSSSLEKFELDGSINQDKYELQEIDHRFKISGNFELNKSANKLEGTWSHQKENIFLDVELFPSKEKKRSVCAENNWRNIYSGTLEGSPIKIDLTKENNSNYKLNFEIDQISISLNPTCIDNACKVFQAESDKLDHLFKALEFRMGQNNDLKLIVLKDKGVKKIVRLNLNDHLKYNCQNTANYSTRLDVIYPSIKNDLFNDFIQTVINEWNDHLQVEIKTLGGSDLGFFEEDRFKYASSTWADVSHFSDNFISGMLTMQKNWSGHNKRISFIVDLKNNKILEPQDLFKSEKVFKKVVLDFIQDQKKNFKPFQEEAIAAWIKNENFEHITISKDGFIFNSSFNNIFGERQIILSYSDIKKHLDKDFIKAFDIE